MERAAQRVAHDLAAVPEVRTQVRTVGVDDAGLAGLGAEQHPFLAEALDVSMLAGLQVLAVADPEPAIGHRQRATLEAVAGGQWGAVTGFAGTPLS